MMFVDDGMQASGTPSLTLPLMREGTPLCRLTQLESPLPSGGRVREGGDCPDHGGSHA